MTSSVDPTEEIEAILARLNTLTDGITYEGVEQGTELPVDGFSNKLPYRDLQPGSLTPGATGRILGAHPQAQPHIFAFQVAHVAPTRKKAVRLAIASDKALIGWAPSENASPIGVFFFNVYDEFGRNGERVQWIATRFYETTLGQNPDLGLGF